MPTQLASAPKKTLDLFGVHKPQELVQLRKSGKNVKMKVVCVEERVVQRFGFAGP